MFRSSKLFVVALIVLIFATSAFAFAANITMPGATHAGEGTTTIEDFALTNLHYEISPANPSTLDAVTFTLAPAAVSVKVSLDGGVTSVVCDDVSAGTDWDCDTSGTSLLTATELIVVATDH